MTARLGKVLAFGASGPIAGLALSELARCGADVRAFVRHDDQGDLALGRGASEVAIGHAVVVNPSIRASRTRA